MQFLSTSCCNATLEADFSFSNYMYYLYIINQHEHKKRYLKYPHYQSCITDHVSIFLLEWCQRFPRALSHDLWESFWV